MEEFLQVVGVIVGIIVFFIGIFITISGYKDSKNKSGSMIIGIILSAIAAIAIYFLIQVVIVAIFFALLIIGAGMYFLGWG